MATIIHAVLGYLFLLLVVRVLSRRPGGQLTLFEFVIVFLIGGVIILSTVGKDRSITNCATAQPGCDRNIGNSSSDRTSPQHRLDT